MENYTLADAEREYPEEFLLVSKETGWFKYKYSDIENGRVVVRMSWGRGGDQRLEIGHLAESTVEWVFNRVCEFRKNSDKKKEERLSFLLRHALLSKDLPVKTLLGIVREITKKDEEMKNGI